MLLCYKKYCQQNGSIAIKLRQSVVVNNLFKRNIIGHFAFYCHDLFQNDSCLLHDDTQSKQQCDEILENWHFSK